MTETKTDKVTLICGCNSVRKGTVNYCKGHAMYLRSIEEEKIRGKEAFYIRRRIEALDGR